MENLTLLDLAVIFNSHSNINELTRTMYMRHKKDNVQPTPYTIFKTEVPKMAQEWTRVKLISLYKKLNAVDLDILNEKFVNSNYQRFAVAVDQMDSNGAYDPTDTNVFHESVIVGSDIPIKKSYQDIYANDMNNIDVWSDMPTNYNTNLRANKMNIRNRLSARNYDRSNEGLGGKIHVANSVRKCEVGQSNYDFTGWSDM